MRRFLAVASILALAGALPAAAEPDPDEWEPNLVNERVYFECGSTKLANLAAQQGETTVAWGTDEPASSVQDGAGCGHLNAAQAGDATAEDGITQPTFSGTFTANLDTLTIHLYGIDTVPSRVYGDLYLDVTLLVDGWDYVWSQEVIVDRVSTNSDVTTLVEISVTGIGLVAEEDDTEHEVVLTISPSVYADGDNVLWVWDTTEVPSGITFNPETLAGNLIQAW